MKKLLFKKELVFSALTILMLSINSIAKAELTFKEKLQMWKDLDAKTAPKAQGEGTKRNFIIVKKEVAPIPVVKKEVIKKTLSEVEFNQMMSALLPYGEKWKSILDKQYTDVMDQINSIPKENQKALERDIYLLDFLSYCKSPSGMHRGKLISRFSNLTIKDELVSNINVLMDQELASDAINFCRKFQEEVQKKEDEKIAKSQEASESIGQKKMKRSLSGFLRLNFDRFTSFCEKPFRHLERSKSSPTISSDK